MIRGSSSQTTTVPGGLEPMDGPAARKGADSEWVFGLLLSEARRRSRTGSWWWAGDDAVFDDALPLLDRADRKEQHC